MIRAFLSQSILHALVAALVVNGLVRVWRIEDGGWRLRFRLLALAVPALALPLFFLVAPWRNHAGFVADWALFAGERWNVIRVAGTGVGDVCLILAAGLGAGLFLRDALPPLAGFFSRADAPPIDVSFAPALSRLRESVDRLSRAIGIAPPETRMISTSAPALLCEGGRNPVLVVSPATLRALRDEVLEAAVAHELWHVARKDPAWGYLLIALRAVLFFNPAVQWMARVVVEDLERRADQAAVRLTGNAGALASAVAVLFEAGHPPPLAADPTFHRIVWRARRAATERRCERLRGPVAPGVTAHGPTRLALAALGVLALVFFVV